MKAGKLKESVLKRSILKQLHKKSDAVVAGPQVGCDYGCVGFEEKGGAVVATATATLNSKYPGWSAVCNACNNVATSGAAPKAVALNLLLPTSYNEEELRGLMKDITGACEYCQVDIVNGNTQVVRNVKEPVVTITAVGAALETPVHSQNLRPGMDIVISKWIGLEGTAILAEEKAEELRSRFAQPFLDKAAAFRKEMSILPEAQLAAKMQVAAMHDVSEGGVFGALWEMAQAANVGLTIELKKIPVRQETIEISEFFDINPYKMLSTGSLLMGTEDGNALVLALEAIGVPAVVIGKATDSNDKVLVNEDERRFLETTQTDELYKALV